MLIFVFVFPLIAALLCLALNRFVATRLLGLVAAAGMAASTVSLLMARARGSLALPGLAWTSLELDTVGLALGFDAASLPFALLATAGGAIGLVALSVALPATLRGFGGLLAGLLLVLGTTLAGLAAGGAIGGQVTSGASLNVLLLPFMWAMSALLGFVCVRTSGVESEAQSLPLGLLAGLSGAVVLLGALLNALYGSVGLETPLVSLVCWLLAAALALGLPPFHRAIDAGADVPANVAALLLPFGLPLLGGAALVRFATTETGLPNGWRTALMLLGVAALVIGSAGALGERRVRHLAGWQMSAQLGVLLIALAQSQAIASALAPALLAQTLIITAVLLLNAAVLERRTGTDVLADMRLDAPLLAPGVAALLAGGAAVGVPGTSGFWLYTWLIDELRTTAPLLVAPLLAGLVLLALSFVAPMVIFARHSRPAAEGQQRDWAAWLALACPALAALPLVVVGVAPQLGGALWGAQPWAALPTPELSGQIAAAAGALLLVLLPFGLQRSSRRLTADPDHTATGALLPQALSDSLSGLRWAGSADGAFAFVWNGIYQISRGLSWALSFIEQRYYLAVLMIVVVVVILVLL